MFLFSNDLGVDLGTSNVLIYADGKGLVVREPCVVAVDKNTGKILQVGAAARNMLGRTPGNVVAMKPLRESVFCMCGTSSLVAARRGLLFGAFCAPVAIDLMFSQLACLSDADDDFP